MPGTKTVLCWSSGKDSAWALHLLQQRPDVELAGLFSTVNRQYDRVPMHAVRTELVREQAKAAGLPLQVALLPDPCSSEQYSAIMTEALTRMSAEGIEQVAFGDLFLEDVRRHREENLAGTGISALFPLWGIPSDQLAREVVSSGLRAWITCIDPGAVPRGMAGREFDSQFLDALPDTVDPCGENGEFHSFAFDGPMFHRPVDVVKGESVERDGFLFLDLLPGSDL